MMTIICVHERAEDYDAHGLQLRSCGRMRHPHHAHDWEHSELGAVHCWGSDLLPPDAVEKYCEPGCNCDHCRDIRAGLHPRLIMCSRRWMRLTPKERIEIAESCGD